jgi:hypothetical protein
MSVHDYSLGLGLNFNPRSDGTTERLTSMFGWFLPVPNMYTRFGTYLFYRYLSDMEYGGTIL